MAEYEVVIYMNKPQQFEPPINIFQFTSLNNDAQKTGEQASRVDMLVITAADRYGLHYTFSMTTSFGFFHLNFLSAASQRQVKY